MTFTNRNLKGNMSHAQACTNSKNRMEEFQNHMMRMQVTDGGKKVANAEVLLNIGY
jgi:hypothetical protein